MYGLIFRLVSVTFWTQQTRFLDTIVSKRAKRAIIQLHLSSDCHCECKCFVYTVCGGAAVVVCNIAADW